MHGQRLQKVAGGAGGADVHEHPLDPASATAGGVRLHAGRYTWGSVFYRQLLSVALLLAAEQDLEYLHAGLPIIVNPLLEQKQVVEQYGCGWVAAEDDAAFSEMLGTIDCAGYCCQDRQCASCRPCPELGGRKRRAFSKPTDHGFV